MLFHFQFRFHFLSIFLIPSLLFNFQIIIKELINNFMIKLAFLFSIILNYSKKMESGDELRFVLLNEKAKFPIFGSSGAAGADLCSAEDCVIPAKGKRLVSTGLQIALPKGYYGRVAPRSGLAVKQFIDVGAGVIDEDYRGEIKVLLFNFGEEDFKVNCGDRIAQLICERFTRPKLVNVTNLDQTERGVGGFGSTGLNEKMDKETQNETGLNENEKMDKETPKMIEFH